MVELEQIDNCLWTLFSFYTELFYTIKKAAATSKIRCAWNTIVHETVTFQISTKPSSITCMEENATSAKVDEDNTVPRKLRKRPARIVIPDTDTADIGFGGVEMGLNLVPEEVAEVEGSVECCLASKKGRGHRFMEDAYDIITNIHGDSHQAFFGVFDGHGGRAAADFVSKKLGKNIIKSADFEEKGEENLENAIKSGYLDTDREFLSQGVTSGACAATVLVANGELYIANVGDCRVVMSKNGVATALTSDHNAGREDERTRIQASGGYVSCKNGIWRVQDSLAVSRAFGDINMKQWIIAEPEIKKIRLMSDSEFLIIASDGLWDKVTNQEAVDVVSRNKGSIKESCKELVDVSFRKGSRDDITVMVVDLRSFMKP